MTSCAAQPADLLSGAITCRSPHLLLAFFLHLQAQQLPGSSQESRQYAHPLLCAQCFATSEQNNKKPYQMCGCPAGSARKSADGMDCWFFVHPTNTNLRAHTADLCVSGYPTHSCKCVWNIYFSFSWNVSSTNSWKQLNHANTWGHQRPAKYEKIGKQPQKKQGQKMIIPQLLSCNMAAN